MTEQEETQRKPKEKLGKLESGMMCVRCRDIRLVKKHEKSKYYYCPKCGAHYGV